jgi:hypothetical protein
MAAGRSVGRRGMERWRGRMAVAAGGAALIHVERRLYVQRVGQGTRLWPGLSTKRNRLLHETSVLCASSEQRARRGQAMLIWSQTGRK